MTNLILIGENKKVKKISVEDIEFDEKVYNNDGIQDPKIAGFIRYEICEDKVEFLQIYVNPIHRKNGLGTLLMDNLEKIAKKNKKPRISFRNGSDENDPVHKLFLKTGCKIIGSKQWEKII